MDLTRVPQASVEQVQQWLQTEFGIAGQATALDGERDRNFRVTSGDGSQYVLKIYHESVSPTQVEMETQALLAAREAGLPVPEIVRSKAGNRMSRFRGSDSSEHHARLVTYLSGQPLAKTRRIAIDTWKKIGEQVGRLDRALSAVPTPNRFNADFDWNLDRCLEVVESCLSSIGSPEYRDWIERILQRYRAPSIRDRHGSAPVTLIHGDLNDFNLLMNRATPDSPEPSLTGIIDFGDLSVGRTINEIAICAAYAVLDRDDPVAITAALVSGYHAQNPLSEDEIELVWDLMGMRWCVSLCMSARQSQQRPNDDYLTVSSAPILRMLPVYLNCPRPRVVAQLRHACDLPAIRTGRAVLDWLDQAACQSAPLFGTPLSDAQTDYLDWSPDSPLLEGDPESFPLQLNRTVAEQFASQPAHYLIGGYLEPRMVYRSNQFAHPAMPYGERRTIHLGLDVFAPSGTRLFAPFDATVHDLAEMEEPLDYGGVVMLRHETAGEAPLYSLYGHLSRDSIRRLRVGQPILRGEPFAELGNESENGGWPPHLHLQLLLDDLGEGCEIPGVCRASEMDFWKSVSIDPNGLLGLSESQLGPRDTPFEQTWSRRRDRIGGSVRLAYDRPLKIVRGWMQYLFDHTGRRFLDAYNNVPHVGHGHPAVLAAAIRQMKLVNTNTRYLGDAIAEYSERLVATLPDSLRVCFFLNSASEANELALRLARTFTRSRDVIVMESAYHGHTSALIDMSPYKCNGPGGEGPADWAHVVSVPDTFRGPHRGHTRETGLAYAREVEECLDRLASDKRRPAAFFAETCPSVGGQLFLPPGYLQRVYELVRGAGGVCVADEVQTGLGRLGSCFYAFEEHHVTPDIVVLGKPIGNGHPLAAVVTTAEIAERFDNGMEYFSTFGGNNVSCAVGLAVLDTVLSEQLPARALATGRRMLELLEPLKDRSPLIGDVRGQGLFLGVELVRDQESLEAADVETRHVVNRLREWGFLIGTDGPRHNVLKIRPPMPFHEENAVELAEALASALEEWN